MRHMTRKRILLEDDINQLTYGNDLTISSDDSVYVTGFTKADLEDKDIDNSIDMYVAKYDVDGELGWVKQIWVPGVDGRGEAVTTYKDEAVYVFGTTQDDFDDEVFSGGTRDSFTTTFKPNGDK